MLTAIAAAAAIATAGFSPDITNPYWPMKPGTRWVYRVTARDGTRQRDVVTVLHRTKVMANGVTARAVHDAVSEHGQPLEDTVDYYAQDAKGTVWYLGEDTKEYENGKVVSTEGSFEAGRDGAKAGIVMPAHPRAGQAYLQESYPGHAEDRASNISRREQAEVPAGHYRHVLMTRETSPLEPKALEFKFYARGVGPVLELEVSGGAERAELVHMHRP
jgi:hypothetical protein